MTRTESSPAIVSHPPYSKRQEKLSWLLEEHKIDALILNPSPSLTYLTGLHFHLSERPIICVFSSYQPPILVLPELEEGKTASTTYPIQTFTYREDPQKWQDVFSRALSPYKSGGKKTSIAVESRRLRYLELTYIQNALPDAEVRSGDEMITSLRIQKDDQEILSMRKAAEIAQNAWQNTLDIVKVGISERQIANTLTYQLIQAGSDAAFPFSPIVSSGPNGANPHAVPTDRPLQNGDLLVVDWGASYDGYISDITRTYAIGEVDHELKQIAQIVFASNKAGRQIVQPGIEACQVDIAARDVIEQAGYGEYFFHRTGHGIGMEGHEPPYIRSDNRLILQPGMTFTVEPGIYLTGRGGVRIEDDILVTENGYESFTDLPRELITL